MRPVLLAAKISAVFFVVLFLFVTLTLHLFVDIVVTPVRNGELAASEAHDTFVLVVIGIAIGTAAAMVAFSVYVTAPLRRMSRSMDRVAAGDLGHRVPVRGRDEGAAMARSFNAMADRVKAMVVGQKELMAAVSHELRSPLARMKVALELLREGKGGASRIAELDAEVDAVDALVGELLLASRLDLDAVPLDARELDVRDVAHEAWRRVADAAASRGMAIEIDLGADAGTIVADRSLVVRVLGNVFENAVRHAGTGPVRLRSRRVGDRVRFAVSDEGGGVSPGDLDRLFEPFFRADRSRSRRTGAGGLGLMIVRRAIEAHGGTVRAELGEPRGLVVTFDLPAAGRPAS
jgi:signal transduction histidine kinase